MALLVEAASGCNEKATVLWTRAKGVGVSSAFGRSTWTNLASFLTFVLAPTLPNFSANFSGGFLEDTLQHDRKYRKRQQRQSAGEAKRQAAKAVTPQSQSLDCRAVEL